MVDEAGDGNPIGKRGTMLGAVLAIVLVAVLVTALMLSSAGRAPGGNEDDIDTSDDVEEDKLVSGLATDLLLDQSDMGADWDATPVIVNASHDLITVDAIYQAVVSDATITFSQNNSTGHLHYWIDVAVIVFNTTEDAMTYYNITAVADRPYQGDPGVLPEIPVIIANVSVGDGGIILDGPHITLGHEAKWLFFIDRNVVCMIAYHDLTSYDPLPNELLIDLANKVDAKIVASLEQSDPA